MDGVAGDCGAFGEAVVFLKYFRDMPDPRQPGKVTWPLDEVLLLCLLAVLAGAERFVDIVRFGYVVSECLDGEAEYVSSYNEHGGSERGRE
jgi:hypothetical protein